MVTVLCPACSGTGVRALYEGSTKPVCTLCRGVGEVPEERAEAFWTCVLEAQAAGGNLTHHRCVTKAWP